MPGKYKPVLYPHQYPPKVQCVCEQCGKRFEVTPSVIRKGGGKFCSGACRQVVYRAHRKGCVCARCGKTFWRPKSSVGTFCSWACYSPSIEMLLWPKVDKSGQCWLFTGYTNKTGYGLVSSGDGHSQLAHRIAWELAAGPVPDGLMVLHTCDTPACVRNDDAGWYEVNGVLLPRRGHLFIGTRADNCADKLSKGREARGETAAPAKLTNAQVVEMRARYATGQFTYAELAPIFGISKQTIGAVVRRHTWKHLP